MKFRIFIYFNIIWIYYKRIESFNHVLSWLTDAKNAAKLNCSICLIGNKCDLKDQRVVSLMDAAKFSQENSKLILKLIYIY